MLTTHNNSVI